MDIICIYSFHFFFFSISYFQAALIGQCCITKVEAMGMSICWVFSSCNIDTGIMKTSQINAVFALIQLYKSMLLSVHGIWNKGIFFGESVDMSTTIEGGD